ncbi:MAG: FkbM family methyltransferase [Blastomonas fulva]|jgi:FkbM family methyltransferase|uniref:FkbM family methyltransferase n=1 Tax=Blastomonas fulva TaxID=1550728 RepID=UPI0024E1BB17|nr:FkbM family methyltransferase [Blastomonas fulva]MDK2757450.1 FkbM family methyltransferase [Blastomonas fulva]
MVGIQSFLNVLGDVRACGLSFAVTGLQQKIASGKTAKVAVPGYEQIEVRPRSSDFDVIRQVFRDREYHIKSDYHRDLLQKRYQAILDSGLTPLIIDAGANIGAASRYFQKVYPKSHVVALEPDAENAAIARMNCQGNSRIEVLEVALGGESGFAEVISGDSHWAVQTKRSDAGLPIVTINEILKQYPAHKLLIAKIDIEGFEGDVFQHNLEWIDRADLVYLEPHDWMLPGEASSRSFQQAFGERDFEMLLQGENILYVKRAL